MQKIKPCPCGNPQPYNQCCEPYHKKQKNPPSAEALMRSRYSAYALNLIDYIYATWHPDTRPTLASLKDNDALWVRLLVNRTIETKDSLEAFVDFDAFYQVNGQLLAMHEVSRFLKIKGLWLYVDGKVS